MYQNCCKKCGSVDLYAEQKGNNTGLYCSDCGAWVKWLGKDELKAFEHSVKKTNTTIEESLNRFIDFLDKTIDKELIRKALSKEDMLVKTATAQIMEKDKQALINILNGKEFYEID